MEPMTIHSFAQSAAVTVDLAEYLMPVSFIFGPDHTRMAWLHAETTQFREPFFDQTVERLRNQAPKPKLWSTSLDWFLATEPDRTAIQPMGFIFHISRCGSSLIVNALNSSEYFQVISEATPILQLTTALPPAIIPYSQDEWETLRRRALCCLLSVFGRRATRSHSGAIFKFASWNIFTLPLIRSIWPDVPCLIVIRDPIEVAVSNISGSATWGYFYRFPEKMRHCCGWETCSPKQSVEQFCGEFLARMFHAIRNIGSHRCKIIDHQHINPRTLIDIRRFFGLETNAAAAASIGRLCNVHAKFPYNPVLYRDDREKKRRLASPLLIDRIEKIARDPYLRTRTLTHSLQ
jgi:hypothetical protein